jgi:hypothetical protein
VVLATVLSAYVLTPPPTAKFTTPVVKAAFVALWIPKAVKAGSLALQVRVTLLVVATAATFAGANTATVVTVATLDHAELWAPFAANIRYQYVVPPATVLSAYVLTPPPTAKFTTPVVKAAFVALWIPNAVKVGSVALQVRVTPVVLFTAATLVGGDNVNTATVVTVATLDHTELWASLAENIRYQYVVAVATVLSANVLTLPPTTKFTTPVVKAAFVALWIPNAVKVGSVALQVRVTPVVVAAAVSPEGGSGGGGITVTAFDAGESPAAL